MPCDTQRNRMKDKNAELAKADVKFDKEMLDLEVAGAAVVVTVPLAAYTGGGGGLTAAAAIAAVAAFGYQYSEASQALDEYVIALNVAGDAELDYDECLRICRWKW